MKFFRFDAEVGREINQYGSVNFILSAVAHITAEARISCIHLGKKGAVGYHRAASPQLFLIVQGQGWVRNDTSGRIDVKPGQAVFWENGEWHESGTDTGLMAIMIESEILNPA
jgi:quercetin dioxygenase-like cupin family protein